MDKDVAIMPQSVSFKILTQHVSNVLVLQRVCALCACACVIAIGSDVGEVYSGALRKNCHICGLGCYSK